MAISRCITTLLGLHGPVSHRTPDTIPGEMETRPTNGIARHWVYINQGHVINGHHARTPPMAQGVMGVQQNRWQFAGVYRKRLKIDLFSDEST